MAILTGIRNKNGDNQFVDEEKIKKSIDLSNVLVTSGFNFLQSINLIEKQKKEIKLTKIGTEFIESSIRDDENISKIILQIIKGSYLIDLFDYLNNNKDLKTAKIFTFIKSQAKLPDSKDGRLFLDLPFQGVKAIVGLFEKANLLTDIQIQEFREYKNSSNKNNTKISGNKPKKEKKSKNISSQQNKPTIVPNSKGILSLTDGIDIQLISKKTIELAISQLEILLEEIDDKSDDIDSNQNNTSNSAE